MAKQKQHGNDNKMDKLVINSGKGQSAARKKTAIIAVGSVVGLAVIVILLVFLFKPKDENSVVLQGGDGSVIDDLEQKVAEGMFNAKMNRRWTFEDGKSPSKDAYVANPTSNSRSIIFDVVLSDTEEKVYTSPVIPVGSKLKNLVLDKELPAGEYEADVVYHLLNEDGTEYSSAIVTTVLYILS